MTNQTNKSNKKLKGLCICCNRAITMNKEGKLLNHKAPVGGALTQGYDRCMGSAKASLTTGARKETIAKWEAWVAEGDADHLVAPLEALKAL